RGSTQSPRPTVPDLPGAPHTPRPPNGECPRRPPPPTTYLTRPPPVQTVGLPADASFRQSADSLPSTPVTNVLRLPQHRRHANEDAPAGRHPPARIYASRHHCTLSDSLPTQVSDSQQTVCRARRSRTSFGFRSTAGTQTRMRPPADTHQHVYTLRATTAHCRTPCRRKFPTVSRQSAEHAGHERPSASAAPPARKRGCARRPTPASTYISFAPPLQTVR